MRVLFRARIAVLVLFIVSVLGASAAAFLAHHISSHRELAALAATFAAALVGGAWHLRHLPLAVLAAAIPLPGLAVAIAFAPGAHVAPLAFAYLLGFVIADFLSDEIVTRIAQGAVALDAARATLRANGGAAAAAVLAAAFSAALLVLAGGARRLPLAVSLADLSAGFGALIALPLAASLLPYGEDFVARANRVRERRQRLSARISVVAEARWGWSVSGIAIVFLVPGIFGTATLRIAPALGNGLKIVGPLAALAAFAAAFAGLRDWRRALAAVLSLPVAGAIGCWGFARAGVVTNAETWLLLAEALGIGFAMIILLANGAKTVSADEARDAASARAIEQKASAAFFASMVAAVSALSWSLALSGATVTLAFALLFTGAAAILFAPALGAAIDSLLPTRSMIAERYKVR